MAYGLNLNTEDQYQEETHYSQLESPSMTRPDSEIMRELGRLEKVTTVLNQVTSTHTDRLQPILRNVPEQTTEGPAEAETPTTTQLGSALRELGNRVDKSIRMLERTTRRLEI